MRSTLTFKWSHLVSILPLLMSNYLQDSGNLGRTSFERVLKSFSNTTDCYWNLFLGPFLCKEYFYALTILIEHKFSSKDVASLMNSGCSVNFYSSILYLTLISAHLPQIQVFDIGLKCISVSMYWICCCWEVDNDDDDDDDIVMVLVLAKVVVRLLILDSAALCNMNEWAAGGNNIIDEKM